MANTKYKAKFPNDLIVVKIDDKNYIVDTGAPFSFSVDGANEIVIDGEAYRLMPPLASDSEANELTGLTISGFIGNDILVKTNLTVDVKNNEVMFASTENVSGNKKCKIHTKSTLGQPYIYLDLLEINDNKLNNVILDTGAHIPYVSKNYLNEEDKTDETYSDLSPEIGELKGSIYNATLKTIDGNQTIHVKVGEMPAIVEMLIKAQAIISPMIFGSELIVLDFENGWMCLG